MQESPTISADAASAGSADRRLLIDGRLLETTRTFPSINPATGEVLGSAPDATVADAEAAVAAARRAFDTTDWSTNTELRIRCLEQLHQALVEHRGELAELTTAEVGATPALIAGAQPLGDGLSDAGAATRHNRGLHAQSSVVKNRPSDYENRTLGVCVLARQ